MSFGEVSFRMKHEKKVNLENEEIIETIRRSCVKNGASKTLALKSLLGKMTFVEIQVLEKNENDFTIKVIGIESEK